MKIFIIDTYYQPVLESFYGKLRVEDESYKSIKEKLIALRFGTSDFYSRNMGYYGVQAEEFIVNDLILQKKWAKENLKFEPWIYAPYSERLIKNFRNMLLKKQIELYKPDVIYNLSLSAMSADLLSWIKAKKYFLVGQHAAQIPRNLAKITPYDLIVSSLPNQVRFFKKLGLKSDYLPLAFEHSLLDEIKIEPEKKYDAVRIGGYGTVHIERNILLENLSKQVKVDFWGYGDENLDRSSPILKTFHTGSSWGKDMYRIYAQSKMTITKHIKSVAGRYVNNMTLYEATGMETLLFSDTGENLEALFQPDKEIVTYTNAMDLAEKIKTLSKNDRLRRKIAKAGQERTLKEHTYKIRIGQLLNILSKYV